MTIKTIEAWDFCPTFRDGPYAMSHVTSDHAYGRILRITDAAGRCGVGEVVFAPSLVQHDRETRIQEEADYLTPLINEPMDRLLSVAADMRSRDTSWRGIAFALETVWFDYEGHRTQQPVANLLGEPKSSAVPDYFSISESEISKIQARVDVAGPRRRVLQLKLGVGSLDEDIRKVTALFGMMSQDQLVLADANGGWSPQQALEIMDRFTDERLVWEEPCKNYEDNLHVAQRTGKPVMFDQCVGNYDAALKAIDERVAHSICIKPAFLGGLSTAQKVRDRAAETGMRMRIDGPWCGDIASAAILHLATGTPEHLLVAGCDLREPLSLSVDLNGVRHREPDLIAPPDGVGLGIAVTHEQLGTPEKIISA